MSKALELAKFGRESAPAGLVVGDSDAQTLSSKTFSDGPVFSSGDLNAIPYLNASKVFSTLNTFVFDGVNLGLGISSPAYKLDVRGQNARLSSGATGSYAIFRLGGAGSDSLWGYAGATNDVVTGSTAGDTVFGSNKASANLRFLSGNGALNMTLNSSGNLGVGIASPTAILHTQSSGLGDGGGIKLGNSGSGGGTFAIWPTATINGEGADKLIFSGSGGNLFTIAGSGNVGVGTTAPGAKLDVNGSLKSQGFTGTSSNISGGANQVTLDYLTSSGGARLLGWGPNTTTRGGIAIAVVSSDASLYTDAIRIDSSAVVGIGTTPNSNGKVSIYETTVAKLYLTDSTLGTTYGGQVRGYGTTGAGGYLELGVVDANVFNSAIKVFNQATQLSLYTNSGSNGSTAERVRIDSNGAAHFYGIGAAGYGGINLTSADPFIRLTGTGTTDKKKWDIRAISASGSEALEFRTINDANTVFSTKLWISHGGNVGIGTTNPSALLHIRMSRTSSTSGIALLLSDTVTGAQTDGVYKSIRSGSNSDNSISEIRFIETDGTNNNTAIGFATQNTAGGITERMRIGPDGNVAIGDTTASGYKLKVAGAANVTGALVVASYASVGSIVANDPGASYYSYNNRIGGALAVAGNIYHVGNMDMYTDMTASTGWVRSVVRNGVKAAFTGIYKPTGNGVSSPGVFVHNNDLNAWGDLYINCHDDGSGGVGGGTSQSIIMGGRVGIGTTTPAYPLHVMGPPKMVNSGFNFNSIDKDASSGSVTFTYGEVGGGYMDNMSAFILIHIYLATSAIPGKSGIWLGTRQANRGYGGSVTQISVSKENISTLTVATSGDSTVVTCDGGANLRCRLTVLAGGGTQVPAY